MFASFVDSAQTFRLLCLFLPNLYWRFKKKQNNWTICSEWSLKSCCFESSSGYTDYQLFKKRKKRKRKAQTGWTLIQQQIKLSEQIIGAKLERKGTGFYVSASKDKSLEYFKSFKSTQTVYFIIWILLVNLFKNLFKKCAFVFYFCKVYKTWVFSIISPG